VHRGRWKKHRRADGPPTLLNSRRPATSDRERRGGRSHEIGGGGKALDSREPIVDPWVKVIGG
jgi:hypothetical protein